MIWPYIVACLASVATLIIGNGPSDPIRVMDVVTIILYFMFAVIVHMAFAVI
jgi:hypothetical protein